MTKHVWRWEFHFLGLDIWVEVDCDSRLGRAVTWLWTDEEATA